MENENYKYIDVIECNAMECQHCGHHNEMTGNLLNMATYWDEEDCIEFDCKKCGKPFHILENVRKHWRRATIEASSK